MKPPDGLVDRSSASGSILGNGLGVYALKEISVSGDEDCGLAFAGIVVSAVTLLLGMSVIVKGLSSW